MEIVTKRKNVCAFLGISDRTLDAWVAEGMPHCFPGGTFAIIVADVVAWARQRVKPQKQGNARAILERLSGLH